MSKKTENIVPPHEMLSLAAELDRLNKLATIGKNDELHLSGDWLQILVNQVSDHIYVKDRNFRVVKANLSVLKDVGYDEFSELQGKSDVDLHGSEVGSGFLAVDREIAETKLPKIDVEEFLILPDGRKKWFFSSKFPVLDKDNEFVGLVGISRDITARKKAELLQQGQNKILQEIATGRPLSEVLETLILTIEEQMDGVMGSVMLVDAAGTNLHATAGPNLPKEFLEVADGIPIGPKVGSCGTAVYRRENVFVDNIFDHELWEDVRELMKPFPMQSCWSVPFFGKDKQVLGTFGLYTNEVRSPTHHEHKLAQEAAGLASIAVERDVAESKIRYLANHDVLTGLPNRHEFKSRLEDKVFSSEETGEPLAVVFVDLDNFKFVNDSFGHAVGDRVLQIVAERILSLHDPAQDVIRFGGDEFVLIVWGDAAAKANLQRFMVRLMEEITKTIQVGDFSFHVTCSIGAARYPHDAKDAAQLLRNADFAMFEAKSGGRNGYKIYDHEITGRSANRLTLLEAMRMGLENEEFFLEYQPQYDLLSGRIVGAEALVRWQHPESGRLMPRDFISLAEESGMIVPLGRWVLGEACRQTKTWQDTGLSPITVGVNVSARQFTDKNLTSDVLAALDKTGLQAKFLELEVTERLLVQNADQAVQLLEEFRKIDVKLAMDDFGIGYSSLAALKRFPLTRLKIAQSFVEGLDTDESDRSIAKAIISLGRDLGLNVVAEGVETAKQHAFLAACQCETVQGFHFGRPMSAEKFGKLLAMTLTPLGRHFG
jgi:diguanylate cyclase (GGDEF)-like protein/PAS domain S-box-containing protein